MDNRKTGYYPCLAIIFSCLKNDIQVGEPVPQPLPNNIITQSTFGLVRSCEIMESLEELGKSIEEKKFCKPTSWLVCNSNGCFRPGCV